MIRWSPEAEERLEAIEGHVALDNPAAAARLIGRIVARAELLANHPRLGRQVAERGGRALREIVEGNYRIVYRIVDSSGDVEILTVFEGHLPLAHARRRRR